MGAKTPDSSDLDAKMAELRQVIREANETLKDLRAERRAAAADLLGSTEEITRVTRERIDSVVTTGLEKYQGSLEVAIDRSTKSIYKRFDLIASICLGEDYDSKKAGTATVQELVRRYIKKHGSPV